MRTTLGLLALAAVSVIVRDAHLDVGMWIDEGLSVGIADRPFWEIPGVLRLDGSPPAYYLLLHVWIALTGDDGETATRLLSLALATATIPLAWWFARRLLGTRAGWCAAVLFALDPFLTRYAQETRMYALVILLGVVVCGTFCLAFAYRERRALPVFAVALAALLYTHNWALFATAGLIAAGLALAAAARGSARRALLRDGLLAFGGAAVLYAPWLPSLVFQAAHTGAPWARVPGIDLLAEVPATLLGEIEQVVLLVGGVAGIAVLLGRPLGPRGRTALALGVAWLVTVLSAWLSSQVEPAWAIRYLAVSLAPLLLLAAGALAHAGRTGLIALAVAAIAWTGDTGPSDKSNVRDVVEAVSPSLGRGDLLVSTQPEQVPVVRYYLEREGVTGLGYATLWGRLGELGVTDWRDGVDRLRRTAAGHDLEPLVDTLPEGRHLVLIEPMIYSLDRWTAPWTSLVRERTAQWRTALERDPRLTVIATAPLRSEPQRPNPVRATVFLRRRIR